MTDSKTSGGSKSTQRAGEQDPPAETRSGTDEELKGTKKAERERGTVADTGPATNKDQAAPGADDAGEEREYTVIIQDHVIEGKLYRPGDRVKLTPMMAAHLISQSVIAPLDDEARQRAESKLMGSTESRGSSN